MSHGKLLIALLGAEEKKKHLTFAVYLVYRKCSRWYTLYIYLYIIQHMQEGIYVRR